METTNDHLHALIGQSKTLILATVSTQGQPNASYAPFAMDTDGHFFVYISDIALNAQNLLVNPKVSVMIVEDEHASKEIFARRRITLSCEVKELQEAQDIYTEKPQLLKQRHGDIVDSLSDYQDFHLFEFTPIKGRMVLGFGKAYELTGTDFSIAHIAEGGHRKKAKT